MSGPAGAPPPSALTTPRAPPDSGSGQDGVRYLSVMWCKASKKKHKRWEGDAVLITRGRTATLKDMEGKDIGKGERRSNRVLFTLLNLVNLLSFTVPARVKIVIKW